MSFKTLSFVRVNRLMSTLLLLFATFVFVGYGCEGNKSVTPLAEPLFRLSTTLKAPNCDPKPGKPACRWEIIGVVLNAEVVNIGENPFQDCSDCTFSHKIAITDAKGTFHYLYYKLPGDSVIPLSSGDAVKLTYIRGDHSNQGFAVSLLNQNGALIAAIASGAGGSLLTGLLGEFSVVVDQKQEAAREASDCGTKVFRYMVFKTKASSEQLAPGEIGKIKNEVGNKFIMGNVNRYNWEASKCSNLRTTPFSFFIHITF